MSTHSVPQPADDKPKRRPPARSAMPAEIRDRFTEIPNALLKHGAALKLTSGERILIIALQSFQYFADSPIRPSMDSLAERAGISTDSVARHVKALESRGLLTVTRRGPGKRAPIAAYDLTALWRALANVVRKARPALRAVPQSADVDPRSVPQSADVDPQSADSVRESADRPIRNLRMEVDEVEVEEVEADEVEEGGPRVPRLSLQDRLDGLHETLRDPGTAKWRRPQINQQIEQLEERIDKEERTARLRDMRIEMARWRGEHQDR